MSEEDQDRDNEVEASDVDDLEIVDDDIEVIPDAASDGRETASIFDLFEPPPEVDTDRFGPIPIVPDEPSVDYDDEVSGENILMSPIDDHPDTEFDTPEADAEPRSLGLFDSVPDDPNFVDHSAVPADGGAAPISDETAEFSVEDEPIGAHDDGEVSVDELLGPIGDSAAIDDSGADDIAFEDPEPVFADDGYQDDHEQDSAAGDAHLADPVFMAADDVGVETEATVGAEPSAYGELPHWTDPPTGQVPVEQGDDEWSNVTGPQWQGEGVDEGDDLTEVFADTRGVGFDENVTIDDLGQELGDLPNPAGAPQRAAVARPAASEELDVDFSAGRNVPQAIAVGLILAGIALLAFRLGALATVALITVIVVLASAELFGAMRKVGLRPATLLGIVASAALPLAVYNRGEAAFVMVMALTVVFGALWYIVGAETHKPALNLGLTMLGVSWVGVLASFGVLIVMLNDGISILLAAICVTVAYDTFAYAGGRVLGSRPFHSSSPNKTWEGTIVGVAAAVVAGFVVGILDVSPFSATLAPDALLLGLVAGVLAPIGDLTESMIKRDLGVKDMGSILPGHGGILDRLDGLLFVLPGVYYLARLLELA